METTDLICFVQALTRLVELEASDRRLIAACGDLARTLVANSVSGRGGVGLAAPAATSAGYARHLVYHDPLDRFVVMTSIWAAGHQSGIHDHGTWGVTAVYEGELEIVNYARLDGGARPGFVELRATST